ncbi:hypothetical protein [Actinospica sp.]|jgi:hypothetical protein|uniref:hypothetical protein n=1 Tax=Actinospica sp. TaxID=1872142 RepID=UPI002CA4011E|nr:hypothetical protein [Actinospica sp.]HWG22693.1 hypothetical protein [Actinospica sp.]
MVDPPRRLAAALAGVGAVLCVLGWYQISGQPTVAQQLPYLASATIPGAALLAVGLGLALRTPWSHGVRRRTDEISGYSAPPGGPGLVRVPDGRYLHTADCPLLDGRTDVLAASKADDEPPLRPCPLCHSGDGG